MSYDQAPAPTEPPCQTCGQVRGGDPLLRMVPPHDLQAERSFLGCCMLDVVTFGDLDMDVRPEWFYDPWHGTVWLAMLELRQAGLPINVVSIHNEIVRVLGREEEAGVDHAMRLAKAMETVPVHQLADGVVSAANANYFARQIKAAWLSRELAVAGRRITALAWGVEPVAHRLEEAEDMLAALAASSLERVVTSEPSDLVRLVEERLARMRDGDRPGIESGYRDLDDLVRGFQPGEFSLLAGRPSAGKTALLFSFLRRMAFHGEQVGVVSLETPAEQVGINWVASRAQVDSRQLRDGHLPRDLPEGIRWAMDEIRACSTLHVADRGVKTVGDVRRLARLWRHRYGVKLVAVDYVQLLRSGGRHSSMREEVATVSSALKAIARDLEIHVMACAQLRRLGDSRRGQQQRQPSMEDLKESGQLEQDADQIMLIHRPGYYDDDADPEETQLRLAKNRNGATGRVELRFAREWNAFFDVEDPGAPTVSGSPVGDPHAPLPDQGAHQGVYDPGHD